MSLRPQSQLFRIILSAGLVLVLVLAYFYYQGRTPGFARSTRLMTWLRGASAYPEWSIQAGQRCGNAPFVLPTDGYVGFLWGDSFRIGHRHQGIDIFGGRDLNETPVVTAYPGYLSRLPDWKSSVIVRIPSDPLQPRRQIWTYYTHLADDQGNSFISKQFPPGTSEVYVEAGTLLGFQGNYSGDPGNPVGIHLHFSIVLDDGQGSFQNELDMDNTLDPTAYLGMVVNAQQNQGEVPTCLKASRE